MNKTLLNIAADMLDLAADTFGSHASNDMLLPNTPENLEFVRSEIAASDYPHDTPIISQDGSAICVTDFVIMDYCARMLREYASDARRRARMLRE